MSCDPSRSTSPNSTLSNLKRRAWPFGPGASCSRTIVSACPCSHVDHHTHVELLALENVAVSSAGLSRSRGDDGEQSTSPELLLKDGVDLGVLLSLVEDSLDVVGLLLLLGRLGGLAASGNRLGVVGLVPLSEGGGVDVDNGRLDEGLGSQKLVVGGVVSLASAPLLKRIR